MGGGNLFLFLQFIISLADDRSIDVKLMDDREFKMNETRQIDCINFKQNFCVLGNPLSLIILLFTIIVSLN